MSKNYLSLPSGKSVFLDIPFYRTMLYTISFEEAGSIAPQIRKILMSYPQVTVVGSELRTARRWRR